MFGILLTSTISASTISELVYCVLFKNGKEYKEINNLCQAIEHGRSGTAKTVPAGPGVFAEIRSQALYQENMMGENCVAANKVAEEIKKKAVSNPSGTFSFDTITVAKCFSCDTLGSFCGKLKATGFYKSTDNGKTRTITISCDLEYYGVDPWDFDSNDGYTETQNILREKIPGALVSLRGNYKPFDITYNIFEHFEKVIEIQIE